MTRKSAAIAVIVAVVLTAVLVTGVVRSCWPVPYSIEGPGSPSGLNVRARVSDCGPGWGSDFYTDVEIVDPNGGVVKSWKDPSGQYPRGGPELLVASMEWLDAMTLQFRTRDGESVALTVAQEDVPDGETHIVPTLDDAGEKALASFKEWLDGAPPAELLARLEENIENGAGHIDSFSILTDEDGNESLGMNASRNMAIVFLLEYHEYRPAIPFFEKVLALRQTDTGIDPNYLRGLLARLRSSQAPESE